MNELFMHRALELAAKGKGHTCPNPLVGCVIVHKGSIIGEGWHQAFGGPHAEVNEVHNFSTRMIFSYQLLVRNNSDLMRR